MFNPACLHCGARIIQRLGLMGLHPQECVQRRRAQLAVWVAHGHSEALIRKLVSGPTCIAP